MVYGVVYGRVMGMGEYIRHSRARLYLQSVLRKSNQCCQVIMYYYLVYGVSLLLRNGQHQSPYYYMYIDVGLAEIPKFIDFDYIRFKIRNIHNNYGSNNTIINLFQHPTSISSKLHACMRLHIW